jgi:hypothetical protein
MRCRFMPWLPTDGPTASRQRPTVQGVVWHAIHAAHTSTPLRWLEADARSAVGPSRMGNAMQTRALATHKPVGYPHRPMPCQEWWHKVCIG